MRRLNHKSLIQPSETLPVELAGNHFIIIHFEKKSKTKPVPLSQAARYDDLDDIVSLASSGVSLDDLDAKGLFGFIFLITQFSSLITQFFTLVWHYCPIFITQYFSHYLWAQTYQPVHFFFFLVPKLIEANIKKNKKIKTNPELKTKPV